VPSGNRNCGPRAKSRPRKPAFENRAVEGIVRCLLVEIPVETRGHFLRNLVIGVVFPEELVATVVVRILVVAVEEVGKAGAHLALAPFGQVGENRPPERLPKLCCPMLRMPDCE